MNLIEGGNRWNEDFTYLTRCCCCCAVWLLDDFLSLTPSIDESCYALILLGFSESERMLERRVLYVLKYLDVDKRLSQRLTKHTLSCRFYCFFIFFLEVFCLADENIEKMKKKKR
jgi:hypothetical protein